MKKRRLIAALLSASIMLPIMGINVFAAGDVAINATNFPDPQFRNYISTELDPNGDGVLTATEIAGITEINCVGMGINSATGINYFTALQNLDFRDNNISTVNISSNTKLKYINFVDNNLSGINISACTNLQELFLGDNRITSISFSGCTKLKSIFIGGNNLTSINVSGLSKLETLDCENNQLTSITFGNNPYLETIYCSGNSLSTLNVSSLSSLRNLSCKQNNLTTLTLGSIDIEDIDCSNNRLTTLNLSGLSELTCLYCENNNLSSISFNSEAPLSSLSCYNNKLTSLNLTSLSSLNDLDCHGNKLTELTLPTSSDLTYLNCNNNNLSELSINSCTSLVTLECYGNSITYLNLYNTTGLREILCDSSVINGNTINTNASFRYAYYQGAKEVTNTWKNHLYSRFGITGGSNVTIYSDWTDSNNEFDRYSGRYAIIVVGSLASHVTVSASDYTFVQLESSFADYEITITPDITFEMAESLASQKIASDNYDSLLIYACTNNKYYYISREADSWSRYYVSKSEIFTKLFNYYSNIYIVGSVAAPVVYEVNLITDTTTEFSPIGNLTYDQAVEIIEDKLDELHIGDTVIVGKYGSMYYCLFLNSSETWIENLRALTLDDIHTASNRYFVIGTIVDPGPESAASRFAGRLYTCALNRPAEATGKSYWTSQLEAGASASAIAHDFLFGSEIIGSGIDNSEWITRVYKTFMDRTPSASEVEYWLSTISNGATREDIYNGFVNSPEWISLCEEAGINPGSSSAPAVDPVVSFATRLYTTCLGREGDESGINYWTNELRAGNATGTGAAHTFFFCEEFTSANHSDAEFVARLYRTFMDRVGSEADVNYWVSLLSSGVDREVIFNGFATSPEFATRCAEAGINA